MRKKKSNNQYIIGIDPGLTGAMCLYNLTNNTVVEVINTPTYKRDKKTYLDGLKIHDKLKEWVLLTSNVVIEIQTIMRGGKQGSNKMDGSKSSMTTMSNYGYLLAILDILQLNVIQVAPTTWQSLMLKDVIDPGEPIKLKPTKRKSLVLTREFNPKNDGQADAICLAMYYKQINTNN